MVGPLAFLAVIPIDAKPHASQTHGQDAHAARDAAWLPTSAKTGENCSDKENDGKPSKLKQLIADSIPLNKLPWTSTPRLLAEMKNAVMSMRDAIAIDIRRLRFRELAQRLEQMLPAERFGESDVRTAVMLLANHGLARLLKFGDLVLLRPDLLNGYYAGAIIRAARTRTRSAACWKLTSTNWTSTSLASIGSPITRTGNCCCGRWCRLSSPRRRRRDGA